MENNQLLGVDGGYTNYITQTNAENRLSHYSIGNENYLNNLSSNSIMNSSISNNEQMIYEYNDQLDKMPKLLTNDLHDSFDTDKSLLDEYDHDMENRLNEINAHNEKEQKTQRLFKSFQTTACAVAKLFKEKSINHNH